MKITKEMMDKAEVLQTEMHSMVGTIMEAKPGITYDTACAVWVLTKFAELEEKIETIHRYDNSMPI
jgi:serine protease inhibitor